MFGVGNPVRQSNLNYTLFNIIDGCVIESFIKIVDAGNKVRQERKSHQLKIKKQQSVVE